MRMKLYLSSYHLGNNPQELVVLVEKNKRAAVIINSRDMWEESERKVGGIKRELEDLTILGFKPEIFDLRGYFNKPDKLEKKISKYGLIWVIGGNAFLLRKAMKMSGFDRWLIKQKGNNKLVYAGYSAGVCVLSPSMKGLELVDQPYVKVKGYKNEVIWKGLGIINWSFAPHYKSNHPESEKMNEVVEYYEKNKIPFKALHDGEAIVIEA